MSMYYKDPRLLQHILIWRQDCQFPLLPQGLELLYLNHKTERHRFCIQLNNYDLQLNIEWHKQLFTGHLATGTQKGIGL